MLLSTKYYVGQIITFPYGVCIIFGQSSCAHLSLQLSLQSPVVNLHNPQSCDAHSK